MELSHYPGALVVTAWLAPELAGLVIAKMLAMAGLLIGSALGPRWLQTGITIGLAAVGIYLQGPGIIWNFAQAGTGAAARALSAISWLNVVGTVTRYLANTRQQLPKPKPEPAPEGSSAGQRLSNCVKNRIRAYFPGLDLDKIRIFQGIPSYVIGNNRAYTEVNNIFFAENRYDPYSARGIGLIGHETTHVQQYSRGVISFIASYGGQYGGLRWLGLNHDAAYGNISFEIAAGKMGDLIEKDLNNMMRQAGGGLPCPK